MKIKYLIDKMDKNVQTATFASGCFWCTEAVFQQLNGIISVKSGYSGGDIPDPTYEEVSFGNTKYAESLQITYDSEVISYQDLLSVFFSSHDPTTRDRQGADIGSQYRSIIFYHNNEQYQLANRYLEKITKEKLFDGPIVTELLPYKKFYPAEVYHQNFYQKNPNHPYCQLVINPKLKKIRKEYQKFIK